MSPKTPPPFEDSSFAAISDPVHLRLVGEDASVEPMYRDAKLRSVPSASGLQGELSARFYVPSLKHEVTVSEVQFRAWNRYK